MRPFAIVACALTTALSVASVDLNACGDKFVRFGRSARFASFASIHPATILVYQPVKPNAEAVHQFDVMLTTAGHVVTFLPNGSDLARAAGSGKYDLIVVTQTDLPIVKDQIRSLSARPDVVPILAEKPGKGVEAQMKKEFHCVLEPGMDKYDVLVQLDHAMEMRLKALAPAGAPKPKK